MECLNNTFGFVSKYPIYIPSSSFLQSCFIVPNMSRKLSWILSVIYLTQSDIN